MKVRDLPQAEQDHLRELVSEDWDIIADLELEELALYAQAQEVDASARLAASSGASRSNRRSTGWSSRW
jgi:hypothetical protein